MTKGKKKEPAATYFHTQKGTIIGAGELGFRVRDGNGHFLLAIATGTIINSIHSSLKKEKFPL